MAKGFSVNSDQNFAISYRCYLGLILLLCLSFCPETVNAYPKPTPTRLTPTPRFMVQADTRTQAQQLFDEGVQLFQEGTAESLKQAIIKWEAALPLWRELEDKSQEAFTLLLIGLVYNNLGFNQKALEYDNQALSIYRAIKDRTGEALTLNNIGGVYGDLGEKQRALDYYQQALPLSRAVGDHAAVATTLNNIGLVYFALGENQQALDYYQQALPLSRAVGTRPLEARTLNNIGGVYFALGENQQALNYYQQALSLSWAVGDRAVVATTLNNIGLVYFALGENQQALDYYQQALPLSRAVDDREQEATTLNNIGLVYFALGENQQALDYYQQALPLSRAVDDREQEAATLSNIGNVYNALGEKQQALDYYQRALPLSRAVGNRAGEARILNNIGHVYNAWGEKQQALNYYQQALPLSRAVGDRAGEANIVNSIGKIYSDLGKKQQALDYYQQALPLSRAVGDRNGESLTLNNIGRVYDAWGEKQKALDYYQQALPLSQQTGDRVGIATILSNIGLVYDAWGKRQQALEYFQQSLPLRRAVGDRHGEAVTLNNIGGVYSTLGETQQALDHYNQALSIYRAIEDRAGKASTLNNIGRVYDVMGEREHALETYKQSLPLSQQTDDPYGEAVTLNNMGGVYSALGKKQQALDYYQQSLDLKRAVGDLAGVATTLNNFGGVYYALGKRQQALEYYQQSLDLSQQTGDRHGEAVTLNNIGLVYDAWGEKQQALAYYKQSLLLRQAVNDHHGKATTLNNIAYLERGRSNLQAALTYIKDSIKIIEELRTKVISPELRQTYFSTAQDGYEFYIDLLMELHQENPPQGYDEQAFHISERSRARTLLELLTEANANIKEGVDPQLLAQEKSLQGQLDATEKQRLDIFNNPDSTDEQKSFIVQQHETLLEKYQDLQNEIRRKSPQYADLKYPQPLTLEQVQQQILDKDTVLLQYSLGEERSYLWAVTKEGMTSYQLPSQEEIEKRATNLLRIIKQGNENAFDQAVPLLSQVILDPAKDKLTKKRILVVADGVLQYIPFAALSLSENQQPLITNYEIINLPSSSSLATIRQEIQARKPAPKALAILADPVFSPDDQRVQKNNNIIYQQQTSDLGLLALQRSVRSLEDGKLIPLPGTRQEAEAILKLVPEDTQKTYAFDFDANLSNATNPQLSQYRIVHFATHGIFHPQSPESSGVVLSLVDKNGNTVNGFLRLNEIFNLKLPAEIVVLSACQTGKGKKIKGEGLVGLTRGFMYAGSPRLLVSLWKVDDEATAEIMTRFYRLMLEKKLLPVEALREAQLEMKQETEWKAPYYWAAFVLQGEWR